VKPSPEIASDPRLLAQFQRRRARRTDVPLPLLCAPADEGASSHEVSDPCGPGWVYFAESGRWVEATALGIKMARQRGRVVAVGARRPRGRPDDEEIRAAAGVAPRPGEILSSKPANLSLNSSDIASGPRRRADCRRLLDWFTARAGEGGTDHEAQAAMGWSGDRERPLRWMLVKSGLVMETTGRRLSPSGCKAIVWRAAPASKSGDANAD
jgi:hypothetical protein